MSIEITVAPIEVQQHEQSDNIGESLQVIGQRCSHRMFLFARGNMGHAFVGIYLISWLIGEEEEKFQ